MVELRRRPAHKVGTGRVIISRAQIGRFRRNFPKPREEPHHAASALRAIIGSPFPKGPIARSNPLAAVIPQVSVARKRPAPPRVVTD